MKLKKLLLLAIPLVLAGCEDKIDPTHRYSPAPTPPPQRTVLIEEYTGTSCANCPLGHEALEELEEYYNTEENLEQNIGVIVVGVHIPNWGYPVAAGGFITPEASNLAPDGITPPQAQINRNGRVLNRADWAKELQEQIGRTTQVSFPDRVTATVSGKGIEVSGEVMSSVNFDDARLHVWVVEDNIVYRQNLLDGTRQDDYVHQNVYRAFLTESLSGAEFALTRNQQRKFSFRFNAVPESWNTDNLRVVVFVETPTEGVLNATQAPIVKL